MNISKLWSDIQANAMFLFVAAVIVALIVLAARCVEVFLCRGMKKNKKTVKLAVTGMFAALAFVLQIFEFPLPFLAPGFYQLDFSEVPVLICAFAMGPVSGVIAELLKNVIKILLRGTNTAFVGDFANFVIGCSLVLPAAVVYCRRKTKVRAMIGCVIGTVMITVVGSLFNAVYLLPAFAELYGMELDTIIGMGAVIYPGIESFGIYHFVAFCTAPINLIKGVMVSTVVVLIYKPISRLLHNHY